MSAGETTGIAGAEGFLAGWAEAAMTTLGFFWMAFWAFCLGYLISSLIQVFVTRARMQRAMGGSGPRAVGLATFFGFLSSSCSFAALSTTRALFQKGAGLAPALAFLLASTNLVVELGILIFLFLAWQFVVGEYVGGLILIAVMWLVLRATLPEGLVEAARRHAGDEAGEQAGADEESVPDWRERIRTRAGWTQVARRYFMEWGMVWKDVTLGFTAAGAIAAFVPPAFFRALFVGSGGEAPLSFWQILLHTLIGPLAAFFTFIGSMGNIPLAGILFASGVSFAGVMAFVFSDLVVLPVLRISARYFGWRMALYILGVFLVCLVTASLLLHGGFALLGLLPEPGGATGARMAPGDRFAIDYTFFLNLAFVALSAVFAGLASGSEGGSGEGSERGLGGRVLLALTGLAGAWLAIGALLWLSR